jgi:hypothetical protein
MRETFGDAWVEMKDHFDVFVGEHFNYMANKGFELEDWLAKFSSALIMLVGSEDCAHLKSSVDTKTDPDVKILQRAMSSCDAVQIIFAEQVQNLQFVIYETMVKKKLKDLEHTNFIPTEVQSFRDIMMSETKHMREHKAVGFKKRDAMFSFLDVDFLKHEITEPNELWQKPFHAIVKTIAIHTQQVPLLPWESASFDECPMANVPSTIKFDDSLLTEYKLVRKATMKILGPDAGSMTFQEMYDKVAPKAKTLSEWESSFDLELSFLKTYAEPRARTLLKQRALECLPTESTPKTFPQASVSPNQ